MKYRTRFCLAVFVLCLFCGFSFPLGSRAEIMEFRDFSVDLPQGWRVEREGSATAFFAPDNSASMQVAVELLSRQYTQDMKASELAEIYAAELNGSPPVMVDNDPNYYSFEFKSPEGVPSEASVVVAGKRFYLVTVTGRHKDLAGMVESLLLSII
jgi:hypothetical protein